MVTKHRADLPVLCRCFPLAIYFTFSSVYMSMPLSLCHSLPFPLPISSSPFSSRSVSLFPSCHEVLHDHFFPLRFRIYVLAYCICFSLSDLLHSVGQTLIPSTSLQIPPFHFFLWLSNIPLYICATSSLAIFLFPGIFKV